MLAKVVDFGLNNRWLVLLALAVFIAFGVYTATRIPIDAFPDLTNNQVVVTAEAPAMAPSDVEQLVTFPIETQMSGLPGVQQVRSLSQSSLSQGVVIFEDSVDTYFARQLVFERLAMVREDLPAGVEPELGPISTGLGEIYQYIVESGY